MAIDVFANMNPQQKEAVGHVKGPLLVVAGAGSGKTRVITHRIANLIQLGTRPDRILAITFTNKAAGEMQERVQRLLGLKTPWITTFHSAGLRLLKIEHHRLGFAHPFTVMDEEEQRKLFKRIYAELEIDAKLFDPRSTAHRISAWKNRLTDIAKVVAADEADAVAQRVHARYEALCLEECLVDFDDLLVKPVQMFEADVELRKRYQERFPFILIDEYQDTNAVQYKLIRLLGEHGNICATGDPDQAIYGWRGADIENILNFEKDFPGCKKVLLEQNYRSTKVILRAAQGVVVNNTRRTDKTIRTDNAEGRGLAVLAVDDEVDESFAVSAAAERLHAKGTKLGDIAVFYRTNSQSRVLEDGMRRRGLPYRIVGGTRFYDRREVKDLLAWLKLLINPRDRGSLERVANIPRRGVGEKTLEALFELAEDETIGALEILSEDRWLERVAVGRNAKPLRDLARSWRLVQKLPLSSPSACVEGVIQLIGLEEHYRATEEPGEAPDRIANVKEVITAAEQYHEANPEGGLAGFLDQVALITDAVATERKSTADQITLMTLHMAKGLEYPVVFITGCEDGVLPLRRQGVTADLEEERRLMYVGITRAMHQLNLSYARTRHQYGQSFRQEPSQFLSEIPADCFVGGRNGAAAAGVVAAAGAGIAGNGTAIGGNAAIAVGANGRPSLDSITRLAGLRRASDLGKNPGPGDAPATQPDPYAVGARVVHNDFGYGEVAGYTGRPDSRCVVVQFDDGRKRELQLAFTRGRLAAAPA